MISTKINEINEAIKAAMPENCDGDVWKTQINGLVKMVWSENDKTRFQHDQVNDFIVRDDRLDLQTSHIVDRIRKISADTAFDVNTYIVECIVLGVTNKQTAGLITFSAFNGLEYANINATSFDNNTERILAAYWGVDRAKFGHDPQLNAFTISYNYTISKLDKDELYLLEP